MFELADRIDVCVESTAIGGPRVLPRRQSSSVVASPAFSPDGRWIAYASTDDSGRPQVFVRPAQADGGPWQVSIDGGWFPAWSPAHNALYFAGLDDRLMRVPYRGGGAAFQLAARPTRFSDTPYQGVGVGRPFALHPDGVRFVVKPAASSAPAPSAARVVFLVNFFDDLRRLAPTGR